MVQNAHYGFNLETAVLHPTAVSKFNRMNVGHLAWDVNTRKSERECGQRGHRHLTVVQGERYARDDERKVQPEYKEVKTLWRHSVHTTPLE